MLRRFLALVPALWVIGFGLWFGARYDRYVLPAFDGHVYAAMAESPRVFTLAPWGYRILEPWIVSLLPFSSVAVGYFWLNLALVAGTVFMIGAWLRRLGFSDVAASLASAAFAMSPPIRLILDYQVLVDPLALFVLVWILHELVEPDVLVLMALFAAGALAKETVLPALVLVPLYLVARSGRVRGLLDTAVIAAPGLALAILLRVSWGAPVPATPSFSILDVTIGRLLGSGWLLVNAAVLSGLVLPAFIGLGRETSIVLRVQGVLLWTFTFGLIFANPYHYAAADLRRLSAFAWPALLPLALSGLGFVRTPLSNTPPRRERLRSTVSVLVLLICVGLVAATDPYQRAPFPASPDPVALVGRIRESLKTARALDAGETFTFDARSGRFARPIAETFNLTEGRRQRWFLYRGFGRAAPYAGGLPEFRRDADLILPILDPRQATMFMDFESPSDSAEVTLHLAGLALGTIRTNGRPGKVLVPREALVRGDNTLRVSAADGAAVRLARWEVFLEARGPPRK